MTSFSIRMSAESHCVCGQHQGEKRLCNQSANLNVLLQPKYLQATQVGSDRRPVQIPVHNSEGVDPFSVSTEKLVRNRLAIWLRTRTRSSFAMLKFT